jgi:chemotaxis methyl-accepting protein methylase
MSQIEQITGLIAGKYGKDLSVYEESFLLKTLDYCARQLNLSDTGQLTGKLEADPVAAETLFGHLNIGYSEFFRNPLTFAVLEQLVVPRLLDEKNGNQGIRIWSAGCSEGQESYSLAILFDNLIRQKNKQTRFSIFGTDISEQSLEKARKGIYPAKDVMNMSMKMLSAYTTEDAGRYFISETLKTNVDFSIHDLLDERVPVPPASIIGDFDLVFCSNLIFYYNRNVRQKILGRLYSSVRTGGYLVTGEAERDSVSKAFFDAVASPAPVFQKRRLLT